MGQISLLICLLEGVGGRNPLPLALIELRKTTGLVYVTQTSSKLHRPLTYIHKVWTISGTFHNRVVSELLNSKLMLNGPCTQTLTWNRGLGL